MAFNWETPEKRRAAAKKNLLGPAQLLEQAQSGIDPLTASIKAIDYGKRAVSAAFNAPMLQPVRQAATMMGAVPDIWSGMKEKAQLHATTGAPLLPSVNVPIPAPADAIAAPLNEGAVQMPAITAPATTAPAIATPEAVPALAASVETGPRIIQGPKGPILTNVGGDDSVLKNVGALTDEGIAAILPGGERISSMRRGADLSALGDDVRTVNPNIHTDQPHHGIPGVIGEERVGDARPGVGGSSDTLAHLQAVQNALGLSTLGTPLSPSQIAESPVTAPADAPAAEVMPSDALMPAISAENTFGEPATAFSATAEGGRVPLAGGALSQEQLNALGSALNRQPVTGVDGIPQLPTGGEVTYEDALARGFGLAGQADNWASAIIRNNQAKGYAAGQLKSIAKNRRMADAEARTAIDLSKFGLEQEKFAAGAEGRTADIEYKKAMTTAKQIENDIYNSMTAAEKKQYKMGGKSKQALLDKYHHDQSAKEAARRTSGNPDLNYDDIYNEVLSGFKTAQAHIDAGERYVVTQEAQEAVDEPWYNFFASDQPAVPKVAEWRKQ